MQRHVANFLQKRFFICNVENGTYILLLFLLVLCKWRYTFCWHTLLVYLWCFCTIASKLLLLLLLLPLLLLLLLKSGLLLSRLWTKVHEILDNVGDPSRFPRPLPDCLCHVSFSRYSPLSPGVVEKPNKCKDFWLPMFSGGTTPTFLQHVASAIYGPSFGNV